MVQGGDEQAGGDADRFTDIVILDRAPVGQAAVAETENDDQVGRVLQEWFVLVGAQWRQGFQPFGGGAAGVKFVLFGLGAFTDLALEIGVADGDKVPGLQVGPAGSRAGGQQAIFDDLAGYRAGRKGAHGAAALQLGAKIRGPLGHFRWGIFAVDRKRDKFC